MSTRGSHEIAMAPTMRWRMPPESWWGYSRTRVSGARDADGLQELRRAAPCIPAGRALVTRIGSATWSPTVKSGFSDAIGS